MLNNYKSEYICDNHDNETLNDSNNNAYDIDDNDAMLNLNNNETLNVNNNNVYDATDTMLMMNNYIAYSSVPNNTANTSYENDDDDDNTGAVGSHHRPSNHMNQNKSNNDCYICSFITPPKYNTK